MKNKVWPIDTGDLVDYHAVIGGPITSTGHTVQSLGAMGKHRVAWISGKGACVSIEALTPSEVKK